ncbi:MAG: DUF1836 domain-containing protein, partial [Lachnospiraceae bacterium]|nr:DUF1836 domain-containing protein [Lachnospiraceae bacterium]
MKLDDKDFLNNILQELDSIGHIESADFPNIDLYMDQLTTFMEQQLKNTKRYADDKVLTKTMINNYAKNHVLPPPERKQYSTEHMLTLIFIYYFKNILSITDIQKVLVPIQEKYFDSKNFTMRDIYDEVFSMEPELMGQLKEDITTKYNQSTETFSHVSPKEQAYLQKFAFLCELCFDIYLKKHIVEKLIDELPDSSQ